MAKYTITLEIDQDGLQVVNSAVMSSPSAATSTSLPGKLLPRSFRASQSPIGPHQGGQGTGPIGPDDGGQGTGPIGPDDGGGAPQAGGQGTGPVGPDDGSGPGKMAPRVAAPYSAAANSGTGGIPLEPQEQVEWCWAAIAVAIDKYFNAASTLKQCDIANRVLDRSDCCKKASTPACNEPEKLQDALASIGRLRVALTQSLSFEEVRAELDANRPVCARIEWASGGAHFVAIDGYWIAPSGAQHIHVADPLNPPSTVDFDEFLSAYHGEGTWTSSYLVRGS